LRVLVLIINTSQERDELNIINTDCEYIQGTLKVNRTRFCRINNSIYPKDVISRPIYLQKNHRESKFRGLTLIFSREK